MPSVRIVVFFLSLLSLICALVASICVIKATGGCYVTPCMEGDGTALLFKTGYGISFQGIASCVITLVHGAGVLYVLRRASTLDNVRLIQGATAVLGVVCLQTAVLWGNELLVLNELRTDSGLGQMCGDGGSGFNNATDAGCQPLCTDPQLWWRSYRATKHLIVEMTGVVTVFSVLFVVHLAQLGLVVRFREKLVIHELAEQQSFIAPPSEAPVSYTAA
eukprot:gnl/Spiro4/8551_TR4478_c0_g1_i1.p1 gnl/Spiro4/8551_TR4478_c0_g1~~gnl/Spiro4/8551_TR4478_c0_g1_i1.p1  ORF type:complete len:219 (+),score=55.55 gnl/Spiro4/8551_TR4478_c0_g1_i1:68-724(+)